MTMADIQKNMMNEALVNAGFPSDGSDSFKNCWLFDHSAGIITLSYKDTDGSEHLVVRPLNRDGMALALSAKADAVEHGRIVLW